MVVGYVNNREMEKDGKKIVFKEGIINFPFLPSLHVTINQNKREDKKEKEPDYYISLVRPRGYNGPKSRIGALWLQIGDKQGTPLFGKKYLGGNIETPMSPTGIIKIKIYEVDKPKEGEEQKKWGYEIVWYPPEQKQDNGIPFSDTYIPDNYEEINDVDEPF